MKKFRLILLGVSVLLIVGYLNMTSQSTGQTKNNAKIKSGSVIISDTEYNLNNWTAQIRLDSNGATHSYNQQLSGGNPGSYLRMIYHIPLPPSPQISSIMVLYKYTGDYYVPNVQGKIDSITYREDLRHEQPNGFVLSFPVVYQSGKIYRANNFSLMFTEPGIWHSGMKRGIVGNSFVNIDGSGTRPNFTATGDTIYFGFERSRSRSYNQTDTTYNTFIHGSDNFRVIINPEAGNNPPVAVDNIYITYEKIYLEGVDFQVKFNDYDPDGDSIWITSVVNIYGCDTLYVDYAGDVHLIMRPDYRMAKFAYSITDGEFEDDAVVDVFVDCACIIECGVSLLSKAEAVTDSVDIELIRRFRDEVMKSSPHGERYVDMYYNIPEILYLMILVEPDLAVQAVRMVELLQPALRNLLDGDGQELINAKQVNAMQTFFTNLSAAGSQSLQQLIAEELQRIGPLENYIGMPISEVINWTLVSAEDEKSPIPASYGLAQNYPNPFNPSTVISYRLPGSGDVTLKVYDLLGREVATLVNEEKPSGTYEVTFDASGLSSGVYYYQIKTDGYLETKKMILIR